LIGIEGERRETAVEAIVPLPLLAASDQLHIGRNGQAAREERQKQQRQQEQQQPEQPDAAPVPQQQQQQQQQQQLRLAPEFSAQLRFQRIRRSSMGTSLQLFCFLSCLIFFPISIASLECWNVFIGCLACLQFSCNDCNEDKKEM